LLPPSPKLVNRFNEQIVLLNALTECLKPQQPRQVVSRRPMIVAGLDDEHALRCLINCMARLLDSEPHGKSVTALAALMQECVEYRLASNDRDRAELAQAKNFFVKMLKDVHDLRATAATGEHRNNPSSEDKILKDAIAFNHARINCYASALTKSFDACMSTCAVETNLQGEIALGQAVAVPHGSS
jgi:hypothetical protein